MLFRVPGPFDYFQDRFHGSNGETIREHISHPEQHADAIAALADDLDGDDKRIAGQIEGDIESGARANAQMTSGHARDLAAKGRYAVGLLYEFATDADTFDETVVRLNIAGDKAIAEVKVAHLLGMAERESKAKLALSNLAREWNQAWDVLDVAAERIATMFKAGATPDNVRWLIRHGDMPLSSAALYDGLQLTPDDKEAYYRSRATETTFGDVTDAAMKTPFGLLANGVAGFRYVKDGDYYTTGEHSIQSLFGYRDSYDDAEGLIGADLDHQKFEFTDPKTGVDYRLELWKGSYGSGSSFGGEVGLYTRGAESRSLWDTVTHPLRNLTELIPGQYSTAQGEQQIQVTQTISDKNSGEQYFTNDGQGADKNPDGSSDHRHYWNLAIRTEPGVTKQDLQQSGQITVQDPGVRAAMLHQMQAQQGSAHLRDVYEKDGVIHYTWDQ